MKSNELVQIKNIDVNDRYQIEQIADLYANVFAGPPWNEATKCVSSDTFYGLDTSAGFPCPDCGSPLEEAYPKEVTVKYILGELGKSNPIGLLAYINSEIAGFSWGYQTEVDSLIETKWKTSQMKNSIKNLLAEYGVTNQVFYGSETGVDPQFRGKGIGKKLIRTRLNQVNQTDAKYMIVRTNLNSPMYGICKEMSQFKQILGPVSEKGWFKQTYKPTFNYINTLDSENVNRVLFLYDKQEIIRQRQLEVLDLVSSRGNL